MNDLLPCLRASTSASHRRLDSLVPAIRPASDIKAYTEYLKRFQTGLAACWPMMDWKKLAEMGLPDAKRRKGRYESIASDLKALGHDVEGFGTSHGSGEATTVGCLYVLEGSIHGGRFLLSQIEAAQLAVPEDATDFLRGFGPENGRMWAAFVGWLGSIQTSPAFISEAQSAAVLSFENFIRSFDHPQWTT